MFFDLGTIWSIPSFANDHTGGLLENIPLLDKKIDLQGESFFARGFYPTKMREMFADTATWQSLSP